MTILENLWFGNISPVETEIEKGSEYDKLLRQVVIAEKIMIETLSEEQKQLLDNYKEAQMKLYCHSESQAFVKGFKLGATIMIEVTKEL